MPASSRYPRPSLYKVSLRDSGLYRYRRITAPPGRSSAVSGLTSASLWRHIYTMRRAPYLPQLSPVCSAIALCAVSASGLLSQQLVAQQPSTLPSSQTTAAQSTPQYTGSPQYTAAPPLPQPHRADVSYRNGLLTVAAANSSLNQILREISRQTGMKITGGVADERVFGTYGPAAPGKVLNSLLDGTGSNMLLHAERLRGTRRAHPHPAHRRRHSTQPECPQLRRRRLRHCPPRRSLHNAASRRPSRALLTTPPPPTLPVPNRCLPRSPRRSENYTPSADSAPQSPNGVKTPQQIYDQLMRARQQQQQQQQQPTSPQ